MHDIELLLVSLAATLALSKLIRVVYAQLTDPMNDLPSVARSSRTWGNSKELSKEGNAKLQERWAKEYGKTFVVNGALTRRLWTIDLKAVHHVISHIDVYEKPSSVRWFLSKLLGQGVLITEGDLHRQQRRVMNPAFGNAQIRELTHIFVEKSNQLCNILSSECKNSKGPINIMPFLSKATLDIIGLAGFNYEFNALNEDGKRSELNEEFASIFKDNSVNNPLMILQFMFPPLRILPNPANAKRKRARATMESFGRELIQEAKGAVSGQDEMKEKGNWKNKDLLSLLVRSNVAIDLPEGMRMSEKDILSQIPTFLVAGHETTSTATTWALFALATHKDVQSKLRVELQSLETDSPTMDQLNSLKYLDHVVREVLRVHAPVTMTSRVATKDDVIPLSHPIVDKHGKTQDYLRIRKGQDISIPILAINRDDDLWGEDAKLFKPDRWDAPPSAISSIPGMYANLMSFLAGPRACIGFRFSIVEVKALLFALIHSFEFEMGVDKDRIGAKIGAVQRPKVLGDPNGVNNLPLIIRPYAA